MKTVDHIIAEIQDRISLPITDEDRWNKAAVIRVMNSVCTEQIMPLLIGEGSDFNIVREIIPLTTNGVINYPTLRIPIPKRAYGRALREIKFIRTGATLERKNEQNVAQTSLAEADTYQNRNWTGSGFYTPMCYIEGDTIQMLGDPATINGNVVLYYHIEISDIVDRTTEFASITDISHSNGVTTITATAGAEFTTFQGIGQTKLVDLYRWNSGAILKPDVALTRTGATTFTTSSLSADEATEFAGYQQAGMPVTAPYSSDLYLLPASQSMFSTIPYEMDSVLALETSSRILESLGDTEGLSTVQSMLKKAYDSVSLALGNRLSSQYKRVTDQRRLGQFQRNRGYGIRNRNYPL